MTTATTETMPTSTPAMRAGRFERLYRSYHAPIGSIEAPALDGETPCAGFDPYAPLTRRVLRGTGGAR